MRKTPPFEQTLDKIFAKHGLEYVESRIDGLAFGPDQTLQAKAWLKRKKRVLLFSGLARLVVPPVAFLAAVVTIISFFAPKS
ncbi:hypothetical protein [Comamonas serinivorans]|uniref:hypothetical protein n=1 Tax=Comamonas serinivorans TaxID=1082851 RepID=UPI0012FC2697|nr:hypothetical protein [Comamonas serinivorans]